MFKYFLFIAFLMTTVVATAQRTDTDTATAQPTVMSSYDSVLEKAQLAIEQQDFKQAKEYYLQANFLKPGDPFTAQMLRNVDNNIKTLQRAQAKDADLRRKAEITTTLDKALKAVLDKRYDTARALYAHVLELHPVPSQAEFAKQKIQSIDQALGIQPGVVANKTPAQPAPSPVRNETPVKKEPVPAPAVTETKKLAVAPPQIRRPVIPEKTKAEILTDSASKIMNAKDYVRARDLYNEVLTSNPTAAQRDAAAGKIKLIDTEQENARKKLVQNAVAAKPAPEKQTVNQKVDPPPAVAKVSPPVVEVKKDVEKPVNKEVSKPVADPPAAVTKSVEAKTPEKTETEKMANYNEAYMKPHFDEVINKAIRAINLEDWPEALTQYNEALTLNPTKIQEQAIRKEIDVINGKIARNQKRQRAVNSTVAAKPNVKNDNVNPQTVATSPAGKEVSPAGNTRKASSMPVSKESTASTAVQDQSIAVGAQSFDNSDSANRTQNEEFSKRVISESNSLNIVDENNDVKLICQGVTFNGKNAFIKFLVKNESPSANFVFGSSDLIYIKNYGIVKKLNPRYVLNTQNILPGKEAPMVYVVEAPGTVQPDEVFVFEMEDQSKQTKLTLNIKGDQFLQRR